MDDLQELTKKSKYQAIGATRQYGMRGAKKIGGEPSEVGEALRKLLIHGRWIRVKNIKEICGVDQQSYDSIASRIGICQSATGRWCCIPNESTPEVAPDEVKPA